jgi:hypothetical protein
MKLSSLVKVLFISILSINISLIFAGTNNEEDKLLNRLMGTWVAKGLSMNPNGVWQTDTTISTWIWYPILKEKAIQDDWYQGTTPDKLAEATSMGTNIRVYNEEEKKWYMAWIDTFNYKSLSFTATEENNKLTMEGHNAQGREIRNVFSNVNESSFDWVQQWTFDDGKTWIDVAKIWCTKYEE